MTGEQLRRLREQNGLSHRQLATALGFADEHGRSRPRVAKNGTVRNVNPALKMRRLESGSFVPEPIVHRINRMVAEGRLVAGSGQRRTNTARIANRHSVE